jgi:hypothetical protein
MARGALCSRSGISRIFYGSDAPVKRQLSSGRPRAVDCAIACADECWRLKDRVQPGLVLASQARERPWRSRCR